MSDAIAANEESLCAKMEATGTDDAVVTTTALSEQMLELKQENLVLERENNEWLSKCTDMEKKLNELTSTNENLLKTLQKQEAFNLHYSVRARESLQREILESKERNGRFPAKQMKEFQNFLRKLNSVIRSVK